MVNIQKEVPKSDYQDIKESLLQPQYSLHMLDAKFDDYKGRKFSETATKEEAKELVDKLTDELKHLPLPPTQIHIDFDNQCYNVTGLWEFDERMTLRTPKEYIQLLKNFQNYIISLNFTTGEIRPYVWLDDPTEVSVKTQMFNKILGVRNEIVAGDLTGIYDATKEEDTSDITVIDFSTSDGTTLEWWELGQEVSLEDIDNII